MILPNTLTWIDVVQILVIPVLLPALVGLLTRWEAVDRWSTLAKRLLLAGLALTSQVLTDFIQSTVNGTAYDLYGALFLGAVAIIGAELTYQGIYKAPVKKVPEVLPATSAKAKGYVVVPAPTLAQVIAGKR